MSEDVKVLKELTLDVLNNLQEKTEAPATLVEWDFKSPLPPLPTPTAEEPIVEVDLSLPGFSLPDLPDFSVVPSNGVDWNI